VFISHRRVKESPREKLISSAPGNYNCYVVMLFTRAELPNVINKSCQYAIRRKFRAPPERLYQALFSEFFSLRIERFC
jgi:hypothetical protein